MFNIGQQTAVAGLFRLAGYNGPLVTAPVTSEDERTLEQILQQLLGRRVFVVERSGAWGAPVPFE